MRKWIDIYTDIANFGIWDPTCERHDLSSLKYKDYLTGLQAEADAGRLFFINTSADGEYPTAFYVDEVPPSDTLDLYDSLGRQFLIHSRSGRLIAGGIEDFVNQKKRTTSTEDEFPVVPGSYAIQFYELDDDKFTNLLRTELGDSDYEYYEERAEQLPWGCLLTLTIFLTSILLVTQLWIASLTVFCLGLCYTLVRRRVQAADHRFRSLAEKVKLIHHDFPSFICILRPVNDSMDVTGGWFDLEQKIEGS